MARPLRRHSTGLGDYYLDPDSDGWGYEWHASPWDFWDKWGVGPLLRKHGLAINDAYRLNEWEQALNLWEKDMT